MEHEENIPGLPSIAAFLARLRNARILPAGHTIIGARDEEGKVHEHVVKLHKVCWCGQCKPGPIERQSHGFN